MGPYSTTKKAEDIVYEEKVMRLLRIEKRERERERREEEKRRKKIQVEVGWTRGRGAQAAKAEEGGEFAQLWRGRSLLPHFLTFSRLPPPANSSFSRKEP